MGPELLGKKAGALSAGGPHPRLPHRDRHPWRNSEGEGGFDQIPEGHGHRPQRQRESGVRPDPQDV